MLSSIKRKRDVLNKLHSIQLQQTTIITKQLQQNIKIDLTNKIKVSYFL